MRNTDPNRFYVYAYLRADGTPYYIGKGSGNRAYDKGKTVTTPRLEDRIVIVKKDLTEERSLEIEMKLIKMYGRKDLGTGVLRNRTDGGDGTLSLLVSEQTRAKMAANKRGKKRPESFTLMIRAANKGRRFSEEHKQKISMSKKGCVGTTTGTKWVHKATEHKLIPSAELEFYLSDGWFRGFGKRL